MLSGLREAGEYAQRFGSMLIQSRKKEKERESGGAGGSHRTGKDDGGGQYGNGPWNDEGIAEDDSYGLTLAN